MSSSQTLVQSALPELSQAEQIAAYIDRLVGQGQLKPGDVVNEAQIALAVGSSRVPVREAVRMLVGEGLLELQPRRSARVRKMETRRILEMLEVLTQLSILAIARLCEKPIDADRFDELGRLGARIKRSSVEDGGHKAMHLISQFHYYLIVWCDNQYVLEIVQKARVNYYLHFLVELVGPETIQNQLFSFSEIVEAIRNRDAGTATALLTQGVAELRASAGKTLPA